LASANPPKLSRVTVHYSEPRSHAPSISLLSGNTFRSVVPQKSIIKEIKPPVKALPVPQRISNAIFVVMNNDFLKKKKKQV